MTSLARLVLLATVLLPGTCRSGGRDLTLDPKPALAESVEAQAEFRTIKRRWLESSVAGRRELEAPLRHFIARYPADDLAAPARLYLAFILIRQGRLEEGRALLQPLRRGPPGTERDFALVAEAAMLVRQGDPERALTTLEPLRGKIIDPHERLVFGEVLVEAALEARAWRRGIDAMLEWVAEVQPEDSDAVRARVRELLGRVPPLALERMLTSLDEDIQGDQSETRAPARDWLRAALRDHLRELALATGDAELAKRLVDGKVASARADPRTRALSELAARGSIAPRVVGRTLGLVLSLGTPVVERRSIEVASAMTEALGMLSRQQRVGGVELLTEGDTGGDQGIRHALAQLAGNGAAILVAAVDDRSAEQATEFAESTRTPVMLLHRARSRPDLGGYSFLLGAEPGEDATALRAELTRSHEGALAVVGPGGVDCGATPTSAGSPAFPVVEWARSQTAALLLLGDAACSRDVLRQISELPFLPALGLGLESAHLAPAIVRPGSAPVIAAGAGRFPVLPGPHLPPSLRDAVARGGPPTWYEILGRDAATLAGAAIRGFDDEEVADPVRVRRLHAQARDRLAAAQADLWSTDGKGFAGGRVLKRPIRAVVVKGSGEN